MKKLFLLTTILFSLSLWGQEAPQGNYVLWYKKPAKNWMTDALPIGNGRQGAMIFGGVTQEQIQFNDKTLWEGSTTERGSYQNFGSIFINFDGHDTYTNYVRDLNMDDATAHVNYEVNGVTFKREYLASHPDDIIAMHFSASKKGQISFSLNLEEDQEGEKIINENSISLSGKFSLLSYNATLNIQNNGGTLTKEGNTLKVNNANSVTITLATGTDYDPKSKNYLTTKDWRANLKATLEKASATSYKALKENHLKDYHALFNRVSFSLGDINKNIATDVLIKSYSDGIYNPLLDILLFQYGRYLSIASSREGLDLPSNLQGVWNNSNTPPWEADIHSNINIQMNYWPTEVTNLAESHMPFINYIYNESMVQDSWRAMAAELDCEGWTMKTQNNIFGLSDWNWNRVANAWYAQHLWDKYSFGLDNTYLLEKAYPSMKSACKFWFGRLFVDDHGKLLAANEWSPEHGPWENGIPHVQQIVWDLFVNTVEAGKVLNTDHEFITLLENKLARLDDGLDVGTWGQLKEWKYTEDDPKSEHRHVSHLYALYPGKAISPIHTPKHAEAARTTLNARGDGGTGWSRAWKISFWARLLDGNRAHKLMQSALEYTNDEGGKYRGKGGVYQNLFDAHPPFQIDGNFGATAGIAEMLVQSHMNEIHILPAKPDAWAEGEIKGLRARGGYEIDIKWKYNELTEAILKAQFDGKCQLRTQCPINIEEQKVESKKDGDKYYITSFEAKANTTYRIVANK